MMQKLMSELVAATALSVLAAPSFAADLPARVPAAPVVPAAIPYNWTGFYAGVNVGYGWADASASATLGGTSVSASETLDGVIGGGQIGYNWQTGNFVVGIEADIQASGQKHTVDGSILGVGFSETDKITYFGTVRGRLGWAMGRWLPYVTGGWGYGEVKSEFNVNGLGTFSASESHSAWVLGGGVEAALVGNWTGKIEYLYLDTGDLDGSFATGAGTLTTTTRVKDNIVRVGLNYRF
jgi:outer membrane immunogenic protein